MSRQPATTAAGHELVQRYQSIRRHSLALAEGLSAEDCQLQSMPEASPVKWHLAHTSWFFETFILLRLPTPVAAFNPAYAVLFNSYYVGIGPRHARPQRGLLSRPPLEEVLAYREHVDRHMSELLADNQLGADALALVELGLNHEQQHQELLLTDLKHHFSCNPLPPAWRPSGPDPAMPEHNRHAPRRLPLPGGLVEVGHTGAGFCYDNETPRHRVWLEPFALASRNVTNVEYLGVHARRRLSTPRALAVRRVGRGL